MKLDSVREYLLKEVFSKMKYNKLTERFQILPEVYLSLKLTDKQLEILEKMCIENDVDLVRMPQSLTNEETCELFIKYNDLKEKLASNVDNKEKIQEELYKVRNIIAEGHMEIVFKIILRYFPDIMKNNDREDIYQMGYEALLYFIDSFDMNRHNFFVRYLYKFLVPYIIGRVPILSNDLTINENKNIMLLDRKRKKFNLKNNRMPTVSELANLVNMTEEEVEMLLMLEKRINIHSLEQKLQLIDEEEEVIPEFLDDTFEDTMITSLDNDSIRLLIETLPVTQRNCILLYFGFIDGICYNYLQISEILKITSEGVRQAVLKGMDNLKKPIRGNILSKINDDLSDVKFTDKIDFTEVDSVYLIYYLIKQMPKEKLMEILNNLNSKNREILMLYFGLYDGVEYTKEEISERYGVSVANINERLRNAIKKMIVIIGGKYRIKYAGTDREKYGHIDNMMFEYINHGKKKH